MLLASLLWLLSAPPLADPSRALAVATARERLARKPLWPGFDPAAAPLAIYDGSKTWLVGHPAPPAGFAPVDGAPGISVRSGRLPEVSANSSETIGGVVTATLLLVAGRAPEEEAAVAIHELFHVYERRVHPDWAANEVALLHYPFTDADALALRRLEHLALRRALRADGAEASAWAAEALALRKERFARIPPDAADYERATELHEGLAQYVEDLALERRAGRLGDEEFASEKVRERGYAAGQAFALLLDRVDPGWPEKLTRGATLDGVLGEALGKIPPAALADRERASALRKAREDVAALEKERARLLRELETRGGWAIVVEAKEGEPLFPERFDPWNLRLLAPTLVLHGRSLRASNAQGAVELFGREALSEAAGADPLFQGMRRIRIAGLFAPPKVTEPPDGSVEATAEGVSLRFAHARLVRNGKTLEVRVGEAR